jgi:hypothetical protein
MAGYQGQGKTEDESKIRSDRKSVQNTINKKGSKQRDGAVRLDRFQGPLAGRESVARLLESVLQSVGISLSVFSAETTAIRARNKKTRKVESYTQTMLLEFGLTMN